jgi:5-methyltetrahydrofolate--homocysteine methyltransferase
MKRRGMKQPLMIGGATTSRMHTAVKIAPEYNEGVIHVLDASRSVNTVSQLLNKEMKIPFLQHLTQEYLQLKADFDNKKHSKELLSYTQACSNAALLSAGYTTPRPTLMGLKELQDYDLNALREYIDWGPFFIAWEMKGKFPDILNDERSGAEARKLFADANALLDKIITEKWLVAQGVIGFWEAWKTAPDSISLKDEQGNLICQLEFLRQQMKKAEGQANYSLADFIPAGQKDYLGAFAVSIHGIEPYLDAFVKQHDDYNKIMLQALADRLAEAFAELLHSRCRKEFWGYAPTENLKPEDLIHESYQGIRPAPGYPACPDHTEKLKLFSLLNAENTAGIQLTESLAMYPASSVCGWYFAHPDSKYFGVGKILPDQLKDYARRKGMSMDEATRWLSPNLD